MTLVGIRMDFLPCLFIVETKVLSFLSEMRLAFCPACLTTRLWVDIRHIGVCLVEKAFRSYSIIIFISLGTRALTL